MGNYKLVAFDMDGTLLNSQKQITGATCAAIKEAAKQGTEIILNTGRCIAELNEYLDILEDVRYVNSVSGALVYDRKEKKEIATSLLDEKIVKKILDIAAQEDVMVHFLTEDSIVCRAQIANMEHYQMAVYQEMFERVTSPWENLYGQYEKAPIPLAKINLYHTSPDARERTRERIIKQHLDVEMVNAETTSLEISAGNTDKGVGLKKLCEYLSIPLSQVIVAGDADNDIGAMKTAGLAVAMGNANERIKELAHVVVSDNDHDGCRELLEKYVLSEN